MSVGVGVAEGGADVFVEGAVVLVAPETVPVVAAELDTVIATQGESPKYRP